jgi:hypothetical protein
MSVIIKNYILYEKTVPTNFVKMSEYGSKNQYMNDLDNYSGPRKIDINSEEVISMNEEQVDYRELYLKEKEKREILENSSNQNINLQNQLKKLKMICNVYAITNSIDDSIYNGSTFQHKNERVSNHFSITKHNKNFCTSNEYIIEKREENCSSILLGRYTVFTNKEKLMWEQIHMNDNKQFIINNL